MAGDATKTITYLRVYNTMVTLIIKPRVLHPDHLSPRGTLIPLRTIFNVGETGEQRMNEKSSITFLFHENILIFIHQSVTDKSK